MTYKPFYSIATKCDNEINKLSLNVIVGYFTLTMKIIMIHKILNYSKC